MVIYGAMISTGLCHLNYIKGVRNKENFRTLRQKHLDMILNIMFRVFIWKGPVMFQLRSSE